MEEFVRLVVQITDPLMFYPTGEGYDKTNKSFSPSRFLCGFF